MRRRRGWLRSTRNWRARDCDLLIYVHAANTIVERAAGQASQFCAFQRSQLGRGAVRLADGGELPALRAGHPDRDRRGPEAGGADHGRGVTPSGSTFSPTARVPPWGATAGARVGGASGGRSADRQSDPCGAGRGFPGVRPRHGDLCPAGRAGDGAGQSRRHRAAARGSGEPGLAAGLEEPSSAAGAGARRRRGPRRQEGNPVWPASSVAGSVEDANRDRSRRETVRGWTTCPDRGRRRGWT